VRRDASRELAGVRDGFRVDGHDDVVGAAAACASVYENDSARSAPQAIGNGAIMSIFVGAA
jgi:hypothetical protein